jgi:hypothetical protein
MTHSYIIDLTFAIACLVIAFTAVYSRAIMMLPLRQRVITLLVITIAGISGCLWSLL